VDAVDRADVHARAIFDVDAGLGDDVRHGGECIDRAQTDGAVNSATISGTRSTSADFTTTWSNPAVCAR
jgi:hypothetical protein